MFLKQEKTEMDYFERIGKTLVLKEEYMKKIQCFKKMFPKISKWSIVYGVRLNQVLTPSGIHGNLPSFPLVKGLINPL